MSFFKQLRDEIGDQNPQAKEEAKREREERKKQEIPEDYDPRTAVQQAAAPEEPVEEPAVDPDFDPEFPDHPDYIALNPALTERRLWNLPAIRFYMTIIFFCLGMVVFGVINAAFDLGMTKGAVGWYQLIGGVIGFMFSREILEPRMKIPFKKGTHEQKQKATERYLAEIAALERQMDELQNQTSRK